MNELQDMLRVQARLHRKQGANALGQLFESAIEEIQLLNKTYNQLFDAFQDCQGELAKANERVAELERKVEAERFKKEEFVRWVDNLIEEQKELREQRFRTFGNEEYLIFFDDGEDYPESMVAPVVMSADKFRELYYAREQLRKEQENG